MEETQPHDDMGFADRKEEGISVVLFADTFGPAIANICLIKHDAS